jgi:histidinol-phosphate aminotransferase
MKIYSLAQKIIHKILRQFQPISTPKAQQQILNTAASALSGKVVIITGSSQGIGWALAEAFAKMGAAVVLNGRNITTLSDALNKLKNKYPNVIAVNADVSEEEGARRLITETIEKFGKADILINNAAVPGPNDKKICDMLLSEWQTVLKNNVTGPFLCSRELILWSKKTQHPVRIIHLSSGVVDYGAPHLSAYHVSKSAVEGLTLATAADCSLDGLACVVAIKPRSVRTTMTKDYFSTVEYGLMDDPEILAPIFLYAATAPSYEIMGKSLSEPLFSADPRGEVILNNNFSGVIHWQLQPENFKQDEATQKLDKSGAYMHMLQNPLGVYPNVVKAIKESLDSKEMYQYPDPNYSILKNIISTDMGIAPETLVFGAGSSELLDRAIRTFSHPRGTIILTSPTWGGAWEFLLRYRMRPIPIPCLGRVEEKNIRHNLEGVLQAIDLNTRLIYLVNPCNPTGTIVNKDDLKNFLLRIPQHITVILDEAYFNYCEPAKRFQLTEIIEKVSCRILALRTFSKFHALSGLRIGFAYGTKEAIAFLNRSDIPMTVSHITQLAAVAAWKDRLSQEKTYEINRKERERLCAELDRLNVPNMPSQTNFVLFDCPLERPKMRAILKEKGIFMPNVDGALPGNQAITTIGLPEHNQIILDFLKRV